VGQAADHRLARVMGAVPVLFPVLTQFGERSSLRGEILGKWRVSRLVSASGSVRLLMRSGGTSKNLAKRPLRAPSFAAVQRSSTSRLGRRRQPAPDAPRRVDDGRRVQHWHYHHLRRHVG
jgi:hypothetical protein